MKLKIELISPIIPHLLSNSNFCNCKMDIKIISYEVFKNI